MHQALWDLLAGTGVEPPDQVLHAAQAVADAVRRDIWSAWNEFDSFPCIPIYSPGLYCPNPNGLISDRLSRLRP